MPSTMRAAVVHAFDRPLTIDGLPVPQPGPGEILVRIEASGPCRSLLTARTYSRSQR